MSMSRQRRDPAFKVEDELDYLFSNASPNPTRDGCPSREVLVALSRRQRPIDDPGYVHIVKCSPCFREVRALQQGHKDTRMKMRWLLTAMVLVVVGIATWTWLR